ncbi:MAG: HPr family phosphocarrier protein [Elusimicrobiota bacterium]
MKEKTFVVSNRLGMHARPAALFVHAACRRTCRVEVVKAMNGEDVVVNGKSVMGIMMLAAAFGEKLRVRVDGPDEEAALKEFEGLFARKFDEE